MSFHYPSSSHSSAAMDMSHSTYTSNYQPSTNSVVEVRPSLRQSAVLPAPPLPAQLLPVTPLIPSTPASASPPPPPSSSSSQPPHPPAYPAPATQTPLAKRRESLSKALKPRRAYSTPNVRPQGMNEPADTDSLGLPGEKKRNRLGYSRTNIACGNCRKRKIRCQPGGDDGRCDQCIRLKKDCQFYAVAQQPPPPPPPSLPLSMTRTGSRNFPKTVLASTITATSPPIAGDMQSHQSYHGRGMPMGGGGHDMRSHVYADNSKVALGTPTTSILSGGVPSWRGGFAPVESPLVAGYVPYAMATSPLEAANAITSEGGDPWSSFPLPTRSMSMSFSGEHPHHSLQYAAAAIAGRAAYDRKSSVASDIYHPSTGGIDSLPSTSSASYTTWQQQQQHHQQQQQYQSWYAEGGGEQQHASPVNENPAAQADRMFYER